MNRQTATRTKVLEWWSVWGTTSWLGGDNARSLGTVSRRSVRADTGGSDLEATAGVDPRIDLPKRVFRIELLPRAQCGGRTWSQLYVLHPTGHRLRAVGLPLYSPDLGRALAGPEAADKVVLVLD